MKFNDSIKIIIEAVSDYDIDDVFKDVDRVTDDALRNLDLSNKMVNFNFSKEDESEVVAKNNDYTLVRINNDQTLEDMIVGTKWGRNDDPDYRLTKNDYIKYFGPVYIIYKDGYAVLRYVPSVEKTDDIYFSIDIDAYDRDNSKLYRDDIHEGIGQYLNKESFFKALKLFFPSENDLKQKIENDGIEAKKSRSWLRGYRRK